MCDFNWHYYKLVVHKSIEHQCDSINFSCLNSSNNLLAIQCTASAKIKLEIPMCAFS